MDCDFKDMIQLILFVKLHKSTICLQEKLRTIFKKRSANGFPNRRLILSFINVKNHLKKD